MNLLWIIQKYTFLIWWNLWKNCFKKQMFFLLKMFSSFWKLPKKSRSFFNGHFEKPCKMSTFLTFWQLEQLLKTLSFFKPIDLLTIRKIPEKSKFFLTYWPSKNAVKSMPINLLDLWKKSLNQIFGKKFKK